MNHSQRSFLTSQATGQAADAATSAGRVPALRNALLKPLSGGRDGAKVALDASSLALCATCEYVLELDLESGRYRFVAADSTPCDVPAEGGYEAFHHRVASERVDPSCRETFLEMFSLEGMAGAECRGAREIRLEYRTRGEGGAAWKRRFAFPLHREHGGRRMLVCEYDITRELEKAYRARRDSADFQLALQNSYAKIYRVDLNAGSLERLFCNRDFYDPWDMAGDFGEGVLLVAAHQVHPEDREIFLRLYDREALGRTLREGGRSTTEYRRKNRDGEYRWVSSFLAPLPGDGGAALILISDVTSRKNMEAAARRLERRYDTVFRLSCDVVWEVDLTSWRYTRITHREENVPVPRNEGDYPLTLRRYLEENIPPEDRRAVEETLSPEALARARAEGRSGMSCRYRFRAGGQEYWLESRPFFLEEGETATAFILLRDITALQRREEERELEEQRLHAALRGTYAELSEIDLDADTFKLVFFNSTELVRIDESRGRDLRACVDNLMHPEDRQRIMAVFDGRALRAAFAAGHAEVEAEYRRLGRDGAYHWVSGVMVPLHGRVGENKALLLVKDISERKEQEQRQRMAEQYDRALRKIYDELYELNITRDRYRIVYHVRGKYVTPPEQGRLTEVVGLVAEQMIHPEDRERFLAFFDLEGIRESFAADQECLIGEFRKLWVDGAYHWASLTLFPLAAEEGGDERYLVFIMDIGAKKRAEEAVQQNVLLERQRIADARYRFIVEQTGTLVFEWCPETDTQFLSPEIPRRFAGNYDGRNPLRVWKEDDVVLGEDRDKLDAFIREIEKGSGQAEMTVRFRTTRGGFLWCRVAMTRLNDEQGHVGRYIGTVNDVDGATRSILALKYRAEYDTLTGIYNAQTFYSRTSVLLHRHPEREYSIIRMDIDRFKVVNELYGTGEGDKLLRAIARLLDEKLRGRGVYGRISGDIFCVCVDYDKADILAFVREITDRLAGYPLSYKVLPFFGVCRVDSEDTPVDIFCDRANLALHTVKGNYITRCAFYDGKLREKVLEEKKIESEMHDALMQGQFSMYLQPKVHIPTSRIVGSEGLVRWRHPEDGLIPPGRFIPLFERNGFIIRLDEYIWEQACIALRRWIDQGREPLPISVNVSRLHIHDARFCEKLPALVKRYGIPPALLRLELTESSFLENEDKLLQAMQSLQRYGFLFSIDDFGSGYSSLNMLKVLPINSIKLDRGFFNDVVSTERGKTVIRCTIAMARQMRMNVISEGVENADQAVFLLRAGCDLAQGFFYSGALSVPEFEALAFGPSPPFPVPPDVRDAVAEMSQPGGE